MEGLESLFVRWAVYLWLGTVGLSAVLAIWVIRLQSRIARLSRHYAQLAGDGGGGNLADVLERHMVRLSQTMRRVDDLEMFTRELYQQLQQAVQRVGIVRFNPFQDTGGDQSFCIALLNAHGDGVVLSSLFSRTQNRVFAKPIQEGRSPYTLSDEEQEAIAVAFGKSAAAP